MEKPKTPEEIAEIEKSRTLSDAELLKDGAEYVINKDTESKRLVITEEQVDGIQKQMQDQFRKEKINKEIENIDMEILTRSNKLDKIFSSEEKKKLRENIVDGLKYYPIEGEKDFQGYRYYLLRLMSGEYVIKRTYDDNFFQRMKDGFTDDDKKKAFSDFIDGNGLRFLNSLFDGNLKNCASGSGNPSGKEFRKTLLKALSGDGARDVHILTPCDTGGSGSCPDHAEKSFQEEMGDLNGKKISFVSALSDGSINKFNEEYRKATGKKIYVEYFYNAGAGQYYPSRYATEYEEIIPLKKRKEELN